MLQKELKLPNAMLASGVLLSVAIVLHAVVLKGTLNLPSFPDDTDTGSQNQETTATESKPPSADDDPVLGDKNAKVTVIEFSDFQCPFCKRLFDDAITNLKKDYVDTGKVKLVYRDYPLPATLHPNADISAQAGECADEQGKFWSFHDTLFQKQSEWSPLSKDEVKKRFGEYAQTLGLNTQSFNSCIESGKYKDEVQKDVADGRASGVEGTPTLFVNGKVIEGAQPYSTVKAAIDEALK